MQYLIKRCVCSCQGYVVLYQDCTYPTLQKDYLYKPLWALWDLGSWITYRRMRYCSPLSNWEETILSCRFRSWSFFPKFAFDVTSALGLFSGDRKIYRLCIPSREDTIHVKKLPVAFVKAATDWFGKISNFETKRLRVLKKRRMNENKCLLKFVVLSWSHRIAKISGWCEPGH